MARSYPVLSGQRLIDSMRYGGYRNPAYALAELIDNSVEAGAKHIELICIDGVHYDEYQTMRLKEIAILDDGEGMTKENLRTSLMFGEGTRRGKGGIGRFGMGLPNSSISQCKKVTVYSWQKPNEVFSTYLDLDELAKSDNQIVPEPVKSEIPEIWKKYSKYLSGSGTLVVWSDLDKCPWKKSDTIIKHSEVLVGRIYRKQITNDKLIIRMVSATELEVRQTKENILPNDPLYLIEKTSTPEPWNNEPMFRKYGDRWEESFPMKTGKKSHNVTLRFSLAKEEARKEDNAGRFPHGKHASLNLGVSIVRADRELNLDTNLVRPYDPTDRWWGVEVEFPTELDEVFGITNNKQDATNFSAMTKRVAAQGRGAEDADDDEFDPESREMYNLVKRIHSVINNMRKDLGEAQKNKRKSKTGQKELNKVYKRHSEEDKTPAQTKTDRETKTDEERKEDLIKSGVPEDEAIRLVEEDIRARFELRELSGRQFFDVSTEGGILSITVNTKHNAYTNFVALLEEIPETRNPDELIALIKEARIGYKLFLGAWGCYEDETLDTEKKKDIGEKRYEWGKRLDDFLRRHG